MSYSDPIVRHSQETADVLFAAVSTWVKHLDDQAFKGQRRFTLASTPVTRGWIELHDVRSRAPQAYLDIPDEQVLGSVLERLRRVNLMCLLAHGQLASALSQLAHDTARYDVLIDETDSFEVSLPAVCIAAALANLWLLISQLKTAPARDLAAIAHRPAAMQKRVSRPLALAAGFEDESLPGDVWIADLAARSAVRVVPKVIQQESSPDRRKLMQAVLPGLMGAFVARSLVTKLIQSPQIPGPLHAVAAFERWPGLQAVVTARGATGLRMLLAGETSRLLTLEQSDPFLDVLRRFATAVEKTGSMPLIYRQLFAGRLLWDWLSNGQRVIARSVADPCGRVAWEACVRTIEARGPAAAECPDAELIKARDELREVLRDYPLFQQLRQQRALLGGLSPGGQYALTEP